MHHGSNKTKRDNPKPSKLKYRLTISPGACHEELLIDGETVADHTMEQVGPGHWKGNKKNGLIGGIHKGLRREVREVANEVLSEINDECFGFASGDALDIAKIIGYHEDSL